MSDRAMSAAADAGPVGICRAPFAALSIDPAGDPSSGSPAIVWPGTNLARRLRSHACFLLGTEQEIPRRPVFVFDGRRRCRRLPSHIHRSEGATSDRPRFISFSPAAPARLLCATSAIQSKPSARSPVQLNRSFTPTLWRSPTLFSICFQPTAPTGVPPAVQKASYVW